MTPIPFIPCKNNLASISKYEKSQLGDMKNATKFTISVGIMVEKGLSVLPIVK